MHVQVTRRFINWSWCFMSAYRLGVTGKAAEWTVQKQKQHSTRHTFCVVENGQKLRGEIHTTPRPHLFWR